MYHPDNDQSLNPSANESICDVLDRVDPNRRRFMKGSLGAAMLSAFGGFALDGALKAAHAAPPPVGGVGFASIPPSLAPGMYDGVKVPAGYTVRILGAWGDPIGHMSGSPQLDPNAAQTEANQLKQMGMHHDGMYFFPYPTTGVGGESNERGLLCINHEYTDEGILHNELAPGSTAQTLARARASQAAHGVSIQEVRRVGGLWTIVKPSPLARRITANTPMKITGPAAGHALLKTSYVNETGAPDGDPTGTSVKGTANNCANGFTPWGTYLTCEENWNGYFGTSLPFTQTANERRYGVTAADFGYRWYQADPRFDVRKNPNEPNRFGWVVEIDPWNPSSVPCKRTALGRFKHEGATVVVGADNKVCVYLGDDERNDYLYKFVCSGKFNPTNRGANRDLLDSGTLYVAKFNSDFTGQWLPLVWNQNGLTAANGFTDQGDVLIRCRQAADRVGATMMDRPEWVAVHPTTREGYLTLTNNNRRGSSPASSNAADGSTSAGGARPPVDAANPRPINDYGHIIRWRETGGNVAATTFEWDIFVECGDRLDPDANHKGNIVGADIGAPDGLWFDKGGRLWIQTDQTGDGLGPWANVGSNTMSCADPSTKEMRRFLTSPPNCEVTGITATPDCKTFFVNIQHPGEDWSGSFTQKSSWPDNGINGPTTLSGEPAAKPRAATLVITRDDGGVIGAALISNRSRNELRKDTKMNLKTMLLTASVAALAAVAPAQAALTTNVGDVLSPHTITFDDFDGFVTSGPTQVGGTAGLDVLFTATMPSTLGAFIADLGANGLWGFGKLFAGTGGPDATGFGLLHYTLPGKVTQGAGAVLNAFDGGPILMIAYGADTTILEAHLVTVSTPGGFNEGSFFGIVRPGADIRAIAFGGTGLVMDDLVVTTPVPEPETWAMMAAGLGLVGWAAARRRRSAA